MKTIKTKAQAETSNTEYLAGISKSAEPEQSLDGQTQTPALPDAQLNLDRESERVSGSTGIPSADGVPAIQAEDPDLARLRADWPSLAPLDRTERLKALIANNHSRRALARAIGCSEGSVRQYLNFSLQNNICISRILQLEHTSKLILAQLSRRILSPMATKFRFCGLDPDLHWLW